MRYTVGTVGKVIVLTLDDGDDVLASIEKVASESMIESAIFFLIGSLKRGGVVSGAESDQLPIRPMWLHIDKNHEILGIGTIFNREGRPKIHLHAALARKDHMVMGCLREESSVFLIEEVVVLELSGINAVRKNDPETGLSLLKIP